ncbi:hypothetical protein [Foetidibacter luteolus]|uniref:hypothetical protein n=1 Tax=Foetidibacter luteolus TaxID=2608880 RepID=UPI001F461E3F|nr:hypothetical protein [Foetidibacter luteolus]
MHSRRKFIRSSAIGMAGTLALPIAGGAAMFSEAAVNKGEDAFTVGMAGYTFAKFDIPTTIAMMKRVGVYNISLKDFHLPLDSDAEKIKSVLAQFNDAGIKVYAVGVIYMKTKEEVDRTFT